uniref:Uncharacterized protein n=1 Tax=Peromyscus maniculatus bairdii TaxID=230844 RepID=A0A8C8TXZ1_PERMB
MASSPMMLLLITLLMSSMLTEGRVLTQTQKEPAVSADQKTNAKTGLDKVDGQGTGNTEALERIRLASHQYQTLSEDLANANNHMLDLMSAVLTALRKCCIVWLH